MTEATAEFYQLIKDRPDLWATMDRLLDTAPAACTVATKQTDK